MTARPDDAPRRRRAPALLAGLAFLAILGVALAGAAGRLRAVPPPVPVAAAPASTPPHAPAIAPAPPPERLASVTSRLTRNQTLAQALVKLDVGMADVKAVVTALKGLFPFHRARPGDQLVVERREGDAALHR